MKSFVAIAFFGTATTVAADLCNRDNCLKSARGKIRDGNILLRDLYLHHKHSNHRFAELCHGMSEHPVTDQFGLYLSDQYIFDNLVPYLLAIHCP